jgi:hypothetical protein
MELAQSPMRMAAGSSAVRESLVLFAKPLPRVVDPESDDANGDEAGRAAEESDVGGNALHLADDLVLLVFFVGVGAVEEELIFFVSGDLGAVGEQEQEAYDDDRPDDEHGGDCFEGVHRECPLYLS